MNAMEEAGKGAIILTFLIWLGTVLPAPTDSVIFGIVCLIFACLGWAAYKGGR